MNTTTTVETIAANPFTLMMDPDAVFRAVAQSDRLARLSSRICRPLDKPLITAKADGEVAADDDAAAELEADDLLIVLDELPELSAE